MSHSNVSLLSQVCALIDRNEFQKQVQAHQSDKHAKGLDTWTHLMSMIFLQLSNVTSLRDISNGLRSSTGNLNHLGIQRAPCKSALSYQNQHRDYRVFETMYYQTLERLGGSFSQQRLYAKRLKRKIFLVDASIIPLSLSLFDWAKFRTTKGAFKFHAVLDYDNGLPNYCYLSEGKMSDITAAKKLMSFPAGSVVVADRGYMNFEWFKHLDSSGVKFVIRIKCNVKIQEEASYEINSKHPHILSDQDIRLAGITGLKNYPKTLRLVRVYDDQSGQHLILATNQMSWTADTISQLYKARWAIESFFKHLKQLFRVKTFVGTSANAVRIQMWCAMIAMLLVSYLKSKAKHPWHLSNLVCFIRINLFVKIDLWFWLNTPFFKPQKIIRQPTLF
jgi:hypothetical protein